MKKNRSTKPVLRRNRRLPPGVDRELLKTMSLQVATRGKEQPTLTNEEIERALISGEHARTLETYFGEQEYAELTALAAHAARRSVRGGTRVLILPGILGSTLARIKAIAPTPFGWIFGTSRAAVSPNSSCPTLARPFARSMRIPAPI